MAESKKPSVSWAFCDHESSVGSTAFKTVTVEATAYNLDTKIIRYALYVGNYLRLMDEA